MSLRRLVVTTALAAVVFVTFAAPAGAAPWRLVAAPLPGSTTARDLSVFGSSGVAVAGDAGAVALSFNGGATWLRAWLTDVTPAPRLDAVAFSDSSHGVVAGEAGALFVTSDGGGTWRPAVVAGAPLATNIADVALNGSIGYAVGRGGLLLTTSDGGETWRRLAARTTADLDAVAMDSAGHAVAGGSGGVVLTATDGLWSPPKAVSADVVDVALATPAGVTTAYVATTATVFASSDLATFQPVFTPGVYQAFQLASFGVLDLPQTKLALASGSGDIGLFTPADGTWRSQSSPLTAATVLRTTPGEGAAYVLAPPGRVLRTLSAGREPLGFKTDRSTITVGGSATVTVASRILAPGGLALLSKRGGSSAWLEVTRVPWLGQADASQSFTVSPRYTTAYQCAFAFSGTLVEWSREVVVAVRPRIKPERTLIELRRGSVYRLKGTVTPTLVGDSVQFWTDRGGRWHKVELGGSVKLSNGTSFRSRLFGCPVRETYHLRVKMVSTRRHASAASPLITVRVR